MTFLEWVSSRYGAEAAEKPNMRQLEAWEGGRESVRDEIEPLRSLAEELARTLHKAFIEDNWVGVPEVMSKARALGLLPATAAEKANGSTL